MPRRPISPDEPSKNVHARVPVSRIRALEELAAQRGVSQATIVREAIERFLAGDAAASSLDGPSKKVHAVVPVSRIRALEECAARRDVSRASLVRAAIERLLADEVAAARSAA